MVSLFFLSRSSSRSLAVRTSSNTLSEVISNAECSILTNTLNDFMFPVFFVRLSMKSSSKEPSHTSADSSLLRLTASTPPASLRRIV